MTYDKKKNVFLVETALEFVTIYGEDVAIQALWYSGAVFKAEPDEVLGAIGFDYANSRTDIQVRYWFDESSDDEYPYIGSWQEVFHYRSINPTVAVYFVLDNVLTYGKIGKLRELIQNLESALQKGDQE